jgi:two-component system nitrate/nitrite response regulator NarL
MSEPTTILIIDDHPMLRRGVAQLLELDEELKLVGEASSGDEGIKQALALDPDLILLDLNMHGMSGIDTLKAMRMADIFSKVLVFTVSDNHDDVVAALKAGADGYLLKDIEPEDLLAAIKKAASGQMPISEKLSSALAQAISRRPKENAPSMDSLTDREIQILQAIAEGDSNKMIARKLDITEGTVKVHVKKVLKKLHFRSRVEAAVWAVSQGLR